MKKNATKFSDLDLIINHLAWNVDMQVYNYHNTASLHELLHVKSSLPWQYDGPRHLPLLQGSFVTLKLKLTVRSANAK